MNTLPHPQSKRRLVAGLASFGCGAALLLMPHAASGQAAAVSADDVAQHITIVQTPGVPQPDDCVPAAAAVLNGTLVPQPFSDATKFQLTIHSTGGLCEPLAAKAVVYSMPGGLANPWPQTLKETKEFVISDYGDTVITFAKGCDAVQFDVITGDAAPTLNNGFEHTLLFPGNTDTAYQQPENTAPGCVESTSTTTTTTTIAVQSSTTLKVTPTTQQQPSVLAITTVPSRSNTSADTSADTSAAGLAATGTTSPGLALVGGGLVLIGIAALASRPRLI